jgi:hypothetical protein
MHKPYLILALPFLLFASCEKNEKPQTSNRYTSQIFTIAGGMAVITQITDNETNMSYLYELKDKTGLELKNTIDLSKCGAESIPFQELAKDNHKEEAK